MKKFASGLGVHPLSRFNDHYLIIECALVLLLSSRAERQHLKVTFQQFISEFPEFMAEDVREQELLHTYRNMLSAALEVVPGKWNSNHLLDAVTRIVEGKDKKHVTGSGATKQTRNRIDIYHKLTGIEKKSKPVAFLNSVFQYLSDSRNSSASSSSSDERSTDNEEKAAFGDICTSVSTVMSRFKNAVSKVANDVSTNNVKTENYSLPMLPEVKVSAMEVHHESTSCRATSVFKEMKDAVTGVSFQVELARGVSITSDLPITSDVPITNDLDVFEDLDLHDNSTPADGEVGRYRSEFDQQCFAMLQEHGQSGVYLHRSTSGNSNGIVRNVSLTRHLTDEVICDTNGVYTDLLSIVTAPSYKQSFQLLSPTRDASLLRLI